MNKIIILNGTSSSGKTSILKEFKEIAKECFYGIIMDDIHEMLPKKYLVHGKHFEIDNKYPLLLEENKKGFYFDKTGVCQMGQYAKEISYDMIDMIELFAKLDRNIIVDYVLFGLEEMKVLASKLKNFDTYVIRVYCEPEELRRREKNRGDRTIGSAEAIQNLIDTNYNDYVINSTYKTPAELAQEIYNFVNSNSPSVLNKLLYL